MDLETSRMLQTIISKLDRMERKINSNNTSNLPAPPKDLPKGITPFPKRPTLERIAYDTNAPPGTRIPGFTGKVKDTIVVKGVQYVWSPRSQWRNPIDGKVKKGSWVEDEG